MLYQLIFVSLMAIILIEKAPRQESPALAPPVLQDEPQGLGVRVNENSRRTDYANLNEDQLSRVRDDNGYAANSLSWRPTNVNNIINSNVGYPQANTPDLYFMQNPENFYYPGNRASIYTGRGRGRRGHRSTYLHNNNYNYRHGYSGYNNYFGRQFGFNYQHNYPSGRYNYNAYRYQPAYYNNRNFYYYRPYNRSYSHPYSYYYYTNPYYSYN